MKGIPQDDTVHVWMQFGQQIVRVLIFQRDGARQSRDLDLNPVNSFSLTAGKRGSLSAAATACSRTSSARD